MLKSVIESLEDVSESERQHYGERDGRFQLDVEGGFSSIDREKLTGSLSAERAEHRKTKDRLKLFGDHTPESISTMSDEHAQRALDIEAFEADGGPDVEKLVESRLASRIAPINRENVRLKSENQELTGSVETLEGAATKGTITRTVLNAFGDKALGAVQEARPDVEMWSERIFEVDSEGKVVSRDNVGVTPGLTPADLLADMRDQGIRPHWFGSTVSANARGGKDTVITGPNPFEIVKATGKVKNLTQCALLIKNDPEKAKKLAVQAKATQLFPTIFPEG